ncbi:MAG: AAA family ATPase [Chloroflexi bacterium]|nr:AAA family ATPase [Chloroflexota bacterium]
MQIAQIDLENVKSYRRERVIFAEGTNAICGPNGAGKSTLLEAIGFVLFDSLPYSQGQFIREGEKVATITIHLICDDGRTYQVVRRCGHGSQYYVYDPEIGKLTTSKEETVAWIRDRLAVEETDDLAALFQDAVGVPQGLLTAVFLDQPRKRKATFDPLLRVDEYKQAWDELLKPRRFLERQMAGQETRIAGLEVEVEKLPGWQKQVADLQIAIEADSRRQTALRAELADVTRRKEALEVIKERLEALKQRVIRAEAAVKLTQARLDSAQAIAERARDAQSVVRETAAGYQAYLAAQAKLAELERQRQARDSLTKTLQRHATNLALIRQQLGGLESQLQAIAAAEAEMGRLQPQAETQDRLEQALAEAQRLADRLAEAERNQHQEQVRLTDLETQLVVVQADLVVLAGVEKDIASFEAEASVLDKQRDDLAAQVAAHQATLDQLREQTASAADGQADAERSLAQEKGRLADLEARLTEVQAGLAELVDIERKMETLRTDLETLDEQHVTLTAVESHKVVPGKVSQSRTGQAIRLVAQ